jgi:hypothetical protein
MKQNLNRQDMLQLRQVLIDFQHVDVCLHQMGAGQPTASPQMHRVYALARSATERMGEVLYPSLPDPPLRPVREDTQQ